MIFIIYMRPMTFRMGWFSTGRDEAARELLQIAAEHISKGAIPTEICYVFAIEKEESPQRAIGLSNP
jgi:hypothetical protein